MIPTATDFFKCAVLVRTPAGLEGGEEVQNSQFMSLTLLLVGCTATSRSSNISVPSMCSALKWG